MKKQNIAEAVAALLVGTVEGLGYRLWDVEYGKEGADYHLTVTIDSDNGITIDDCERVHRAIDPVLDEADPIDDAYILNVSSPGVERVLRTDAHLAASIGERTECKLFAAIDGQKTIRGTLEAFDAATVTIDGRAIERSAVARIRTVFFD